MTLFEYGGRYVDTGCTLHNKAYTRWKEKLEGLEDGLQAFVKNTIWMLEEFFQNLPSRNRQDYLLAYANDCWTMEEAMQQWKDTEDEGEVWEDATVDLDTVSFDYPVNISLVPIMETRSNRLTLAEQMTFESFARFLYVDLYRAWRPGICPGGVPTVAVGSWRRADTIRSIATG